MPATDAAIRPTVVKIGGAALDAGDDAVAIWRHLAAEHARLRAEGGGIVLVHGGGAAVDRHLERIGHDPAAAGRIDGLRVTPGDQIDEVVAILGGIMNARVVDRLRTAGAPAVGLRLGDAGMCALDHLEQAGRVGRIAASDRQPHDAGTLVATLLAAGFLPAVASVGTAEALAGGGRGFLNVNADDAAAGLAAVLGAAALVLLTDVPGVRGEDGDVLAELDEDAAERAIASGVIAGGMIPKVRGALETSARSGAPVTITTWRRDDAAGAGTVVRARAAGASPESAS